MAVVAPRGRTVDPQLIRNLTAALAPIGPDGSHFWVSGRAGLGHALLKIPGDPPGDRQPCTLDGQVWIVADARLDARAELLDALKRAGLPLKPDATHAELILRAYHAWGRSCVEHLLGDFAFAVWDGRSHTLFCVRDHFGVAPLYYARIGEALIVSSSLDCIRLHPAVTARLNETAIGDYLLFGCNQDLQTTFFTDVQKVPPAHALTWSDAGVRSGRYWELRRARPVNRQPAEIVEGFIQVARTAVQDRLAPGPIAILMSGGLDSTTVTAVAAAGPARAAGSSIMSHVTGSTRLNPSEEPYHAAAVAAALEIPIRVYDGDPYLIERVGARGWHAPAEPRFSLHVTPMHQIFEAVSATGGRVFLTGEGGDLGLKPDRDLRFRWLPSGLRVWLHRRSGSRGVFDQPFEGSWLDQDFVTRAGLADRWRSVMERTRAMSKRRAVTEAPIPVAALSLWHADYIDLPLVFRHPFYDVRLLNFFQSIPQQWLIKKRIVREAMRGILPDVILERPKTPLTGHFYQPLAVARPDPGLEELARTPDLAAYVARGPLEQAIRQPTVTKHYVQRVIFSLGLAFWLRERARAPKLVNSIHGGMVEQLF